MFLSFLRMGPWIQTWFLVISLQPFPANIILVCCTELSDFCHAIFASTIIVFFKLTGLEINTHYYYQVGVPDNGTSEVMSFSTKDGNLVFAVSTRILFFVSHTCQPVMQWHLQLLISGSPEILIRDKEKRTLLGIKALRDYYCCHTFMQIGDV